MHLKPELCAAILESPRVYRWNYITEYRSAFISESYYRSLLGISGRLVFERTNIDDAQLCVSDRNAFAGKPIAVVTGTADTDHPRAVDAAIVDWLKEIGATARHLYLGDWGVEGNGHMIMLEENSDEGANLIIQWIRSEP